MSKSSRRFPARPPTRRVRRVTLRLSDRERLGIERRAAAVGRPVSTYLREVGLGRKMRARTLYIDRTAIAQLSRIGVNLKQLRRVAEAAGDGEMVREVEESLVAVRAALDQLMGRM
jgi:hypothetical protein